MKALLVFIFIGIAIAAIYGAYKIGDIGSERYGMRLLVSWSGLSLALIPIALLTGYMTGEQLVHDPNGMVAVFVSFALLFNAVLSNVKKSNFGFGLTFTGLQVIVLVTLIPLIFAMVGTHRSHADD